MEQFLIDFQRCIPRPFFVQIGANDGVSEDPIHRFLMQRAWDGIMVEPIPYLFEVLKANRRTARGKLVFENVAIAEVIGEKPFYYIVDEKEVLPKWATGINSFNKEHLLWQKKNFPDIESFIAETQVECIPLEALFERNSVVHIDLLLIDVEGYDFEVLKQLPTQSIRPTVVIYEQQCLGKDIPEAKQFMTGLGYACFECGGDVIAVCDDGSETSTKLLKRLRNLFRRVQA